MSEVLLMKLLRENSIDCDEYEKLSKKAKYKLLKELAFKLKVDQDYLEMCHNSKTDCDDNNYVSTLAKLKNDELNAKFYAYKNRFLYKQEQRDAFKSKVKSLFIK